MNGNLSFVKHLVSLGAKPDSPLPETMLSEPISTLVQERRDKYKQTKNRDKILLIDAFLTKSLAIHIAAEYNQKDILLYFISLGIKSNVKTNWGHTPLDIASRCGHRTIVETLLENHNEIEQNQVTADICLSLGKIIAPQHGTLIHALVLSLPFSENLFLNFIKMGLCLDSINNQGSTPLHLMVQENRDTERDKVCEFLLDNGARVDIADNNGNRPLHLASCGTHIIKRIAKDNWDIENSSGCTALHLAAQRGNVEITKILLSLSAKALAPNFLLLSPVTLAAMNGHTEIIDIIQPDSLSYSFTSYLSAIASGDFDTIKKLRRPTFAKDEIQAHLFRSILRGVVQYGKVEIPNIDDIEPEKNNMVHASLKMAVCTGHLEVVKYLFETGKTKEAASKALTMAISTGHVEITSFLLDKIEKGPLWDWALLEAANKGQIGIAEMLIGKGVDVNLMSGQKSPIFGATFHKQLKMIEWLVGQGCNIDQPERAPMHIATSNEYLEVAELLVNLGADLNIKTKYGDTPLHLATSPKIVKLLIDNGADVNATNNKMLTPLHCSERHMIEKAVLLVDGGAQLFSGFNGITPAALKGDTEKIFITDLTKRAAWKIAAVRGDVNMASFLKQHLKIEEIDAAETVMVANEGIIRVLLEIGMPYGFLCMAMVARRPVSILKLIREHGADLEARNEGGTALQWAVEIGSVEHVRWLVKEGADVEASRTFGNVTIRDSAFQLPESESKYEIIELLQTRNAY